MNLFQNIISFSKNKYPHIILLILFLFCFLTLLPALSPGLPYKGDNTPHYVTTVRLAEMFQAGNFRFWDSDANFGFPLLYYYQPLPYLITSVLYILLPFIDTLIIYKFLLILLFSLYPITVYISARWIGFDTKIALFAAVLSIMLRSFESFGFEISSYLGWGLFTMAFGMVLFPLAIGATVREYFGQRKFFLPVLFLSLTFLMHSFVGIAANVAVALLFFFSQSTSSFSIYQKSKDFLYLSLLFILEFLVVSFWIVPLLTSLSYYGGHPFDVKSVLYGLGADTVLRLFWNGLLFDFQRFPIFTILVFLGILFSLFSSLFAQVFTHSLFKQKQFLIYSVVSFFVFLLLIIGPMSLPFLRFFPGFSIIHFSRFFSGLDFFAVLLAAISLALISDIIIPFITSHAFSKISFQKKLVQFITFVFLFLFFSYLFVDAYFDFSTNAKTFTAEKDTSFLDIMQFLSSLPEGRVYPSPVITLEYNSLLYLIPFYSDKPMSISYAVGSQDSLGYFYADQLDYTNSETYNLLHIKYIFALQDDNYSSLYSSLGTLLYANDKYALYGVNLSSGYFDLIQSNTVLFSDNKNARETILQWANSSSVASKNFLTIADDTSQDFFVNRGYISFFTINDTISFSSNTSHSDSSCGVIRSETADQGVYTTNVNISSFCFVLLKVGAHKDWRVTVDGQEQQWVQVSPAFMAVPVSSGEHTIEFQFAIRWPRIVLFLLSLFIIASVYFYEKVYVVTNKG